MLVPIVGCFVACLMLFLLSAFKIGHTVLEMSTYLFSLEKNKELIVILVDVIDTFLLGTVFYIVFLGLYELFIDADVETPPWLVITSLDDLKKKLISAIIMVIGVYFLSVIITPAISKEEKALIAVGISLVIFSLSYFISKK